MYNRIILMGRLVAAPELRQTQTGLSVCRFRIAVDRFAKQGEERKADFISCVAWRQTADFVSRWFAKGQLIHIEPGEMHYVLNRYDKPVKMVSTLAPYTNPDKVEVENYTY